MNRWRFAAAAATFGGVVDAALRSPGRGPLSGLAAAGSSRALQREFPWLEHRHPHIPEGYAPHFEFPAALVSSFRAAA